VPESSASSWSHNTVGPRPSAFTLNQSSTESAPVKHFSTTSSYQVCQTAEQCSAQLFLIKAPKDMPHAMMCKGRLSTDMLPSIMNSALSGRVRALLRMIHPSLCNVMMTKRFHLLLTTVGHGGRQQQYGCVR